MAVIYARTRLAAAVLGLAALLPACTVHKTEVPALTGPSTLSLNISIAANPDVVPWDGMSYSTVIITALDSNGQPQSNLNLRVGVALGQLSATSVSTDNTGRAAVIYTAPPRPVVGTGAQKIDIQVTPIGSNFDNSTPRVASIMLVPPGVVAGPPSQLVPSFVVPSLNVGDAGVFIAKVVDPSGNDVTNQVASFQWNFGDGGTASGQSVTHTYKAIGTFQVTLTITDRGGRTNFVTQSLTVGQGTLPVATFVVSPAPPAVLGQTINFNATGSTAAPGHSITAYAWDFGDGTSGNGPVVTHSYSQTGTYNVTLIVTDDAGRQSLLFQQPIAVNNGNPTPDFTFNPSAPKSGQQVTFDASGTQAAPGRTIVSFSWAFGDGGSGTGQTVPHAFGVINNAPTTYNVLLTVTDNQGKSASVTKAITINP